MDLSVVNATSGLTHHHHSAGASGSYPMVAGPAHIPQPPPYKQHDNPPAYSEFTSGPNQYGAATAPHQYGQPSPGQAYPYGTAPMGGARRTPPPLYAGAAPAAAPVGASVPPPASRAPPLSRQYQYGQGQGWSGSGSGGLPASAAAPSAAPPAATSSLGQGWPDVGANRNTTTTGLVRPSRE